MRLVDASRYFDKTIVRDAYTRVAFEYAQVSAFTDTQATGTAARRRIVSFAGDATMPTRKAIYYSGEVWLLGTGIKDNFQNVTLRNSMVAKKSNGLFKLRTPGQAALGAGGTDAYGQFDYLKSTVNTTATSEYDPQFNIYFASTETIGKNTFLYLDGRLFSVRSVYEDLEGFKATEADEIDSALVTLTFNDTGVYDPITDTYDNLNTVTTTGVQIDMYKRYKFATEADPTNKAGDMTLLVAASAVTPTPGYSATIGSTVYRVMDVQPLDDAWQLHLRKA